MTHCCSQCSFTANFESALMMHRQLHHEGSGHQFRTEYLDTGTTALKERSATIPRSSLEQSYVKEKSNKVAVRTSSATRLFDKLRARICRSRTLFSHPEENADNDLSAFSECTSKAFKDSPLLAKRNNIITTIKESKECFGCHLCSFEADRITVLDRHLLNDHKIGMDNLLKLVMSKTKDGLSEECSTNIYGIKQPYYRPPDDIIEEGEFIIETVTPKIKILKHASTNTEDMMDLKDNCQIIANEVEKLMSYPIEKCDKNELITKMQTLNECMCKFVDSSNMIKKVLTKEYESKSLRGDRSGEPFFDLRLGDHSSPRDWERAHSEKMERCRKKYGEIRTDKSKPTSESFFF